MKNPKKSAGCNTPKSELEKLTATKKLLDQFKAALDALGTIQPIPEDAKPAIQSLIDAVDAFNAPKKCVHTLNILPSIVNLLEVKPTDHSATIVMLLDRLPQYGVETIGKTELVDEWLKSQGIKHCSVMFKWS